MSHKGRAMVVAYLRTKFHSGNLLFRTPELRCHGAAMRAGFCAQQQNTHKEITELCVQRTLAPLLSAHMLSGFKLLTKWSIF